MRYRRDMLRLYGIPESEIAATLRAAGQAGIDLERLEITTTAQNASAAAALRRGSSSATPAMGTGWSCGRKAAGTDRTPSPARGPRPAGVTWSSRQRQRWGSCTPSRGTIRLSTQLHGMPDWVVDAVLVHELAHLR